MGARPTLQHGPSVQVIGSRRLRRLATAELRFLASDSHNVVDGTRSNGIDRTHARRSGAPVRPLVPLLGQPGAGIRLAPRKTVVDAIYSPSCPAPEAGSHDTRGTK
jgi:hypothetical protein